MDRFQVTSNLTEFWVDAGKSATVTNIGSATVYGSPDAPPTSTATAAWSLAPGASRVEDVGAVWVRTASGTSSALVVEPMASGFAVDTGTGTPSPVSNTGVSGIYVDVMAVPYLAKGDGVTDDTVAIQTAINAVRSAGGGTVYFRGGRTFNFTNLTRPCDVPVDLLGGGHGAVLNCIADSGAGTFAIDITNYDANTHVRKKISNLYVRGNVASPVPGTSPRAMWGVKTLGFDVWTNVRVSGFKCGAYVMEHHEEFHSCDFETNYYGAYWGPGSVNNGNQMFFGGTLTGQTFASIGVATGELVSGQFFGTHLGFAPYCIYKEATTAAEDIVTASLFSGASFESWGNGMIYDESKLSFVRDSVFLGCGMDFEGDRTNVFNTVIAARAKDWVIRASGIQNVRIESPRYTLPTNAIGLGFIDCGFVADTHWADLQPVIDNLVAEGGKIVQAANYVSNFTGRAGAQDVEVLYALDAVTKNDVVYDGGTALVAKTAGSAPKGVALQSGSAKYIPVATGGTVSVKATGAIAAAKYVRASGALDGAVVAQPDGVRGGFGVSGAAASGGFVTVSLAPKTAPGAVFTRAVRNSNQSIPAATYTAVAFDAPTQDSEVLWASANPSRFTISTSGVYTVEAEVHWAQGAANRMLILQVNGSSVRARDDRPTVSIATGGTLIQSQRVSCTTNLSAGEYIEAKLFQDSAGAINLVYDAALWGFAATMTVRRVDI